MVDCLPSFIAAGSFYFFLIIPHLEETTAAIKINPSLITSHAADIACVQHHRQQITNLYH
jgi:hypothetical protein